ncbi:MAG: NADH-quinone oxidoreductase subunit N [Thermodesulfovibrionales bacterium]|nr:NADH-quinone oxidoreductase subunit N [Nitrospinota bacterium]MCG2709565.1 NADH-quinone oxidoreductase subunit N [Thermodesulfovibrionales bacterium]MDP3049655.1 NADH-quinone oxidoreductase subunit N [Thermodesulfovibrionales bacterium]
MNFQLPDLTPMIPELLMTALALIVILIDLLIKKKEVIALISIAGVAVVALSLVGSSGITFGGMYISDGYSTFFKLIFFINVILTILISIKYIAVEKVNYGEYYSLILFSTIGMMIMASAGDLIVLYLGLELMALSTYVLAGFIRHDIKSNEAALKYFLLGAFSSAFLLYGISIVYGLTGTTDLKAIASFINERGLTDNFSLLLSVIFLIVAFGFKIAAAPFHMWAPDVYEGAPTSITAFMSVGPKAAGFAVLGRVFMVAFVSVKVDWVAILIPISILTMAVGNIVALSQTNIKRMLAYSSIAHAGYALLGIITANNEGLASMMNYLMIYAFMNIGAFAVIIMLRSEGFKGDSIYDYEGLAKTHPLAAVLMLIFMFSLTGIPPTAGFIGKLYIFMAAINAGYTWLVVIAVIFSAISAYFYLRIIMYMYMKEPKTSVQLSVSPGIALALAITVIAVLVIGVLPSAVINFARIAASGF